MSRAEEAWREFCDKTSPNPIWGTDAEIMFRQGCLSGQRDA